MKQVNRKIGLLLLAKYQTYPKEQDRPYFHQTRKANLKHRSKPGYMHPQALNHMRFEDNLPSDLNNIEPGNCDD